MSRNQTLAHELALGAAANTAILGTWMAALILWSRRCEARKHRP